MCAGCHAFLDPMGLALENYDAVGRWRTLDEGQPIDASGELITGQKFANFEELQSVLVSDLQDGFVQNLAQQLLVYALGRGLEYTDKLAVREIVRRAKEDDLRFQTKGIARCNGRAKT